MKRVILDKDLSKDILQGIGYYVFLAGLARLCVPPIREESIFVKVLFVVFLLWLMWFISTYILVHIVRPVVKLYHPSFTLPEVDPDHIYKSGWKQIVFTKSFFAMLLLYSLSMLLGWFVVGAGLES